MMDEPCVNDQVVHLDRMLPEYYRLCGCDKKGIPIVEKLQQLGLEKEGAEVK